MKKLTTYGEIGSYSRIEFNEYNASQGLESVSYMITGDSTKNPFLTDETYDQIEIIESVKDDMNPEERDKYYEKYIQLLEEKSGIAKFEIGYIGPDNRRTTMKKYRLRSTDGFQFEMLMRIFRAGTQEMNPVKEFERNKSVTLKIIENDPEQFIGGTVQIKQHRDVLKIHIPGRDVPHYLVGVALMTLLPALEESMKKEIERDKSISSYIKYVYRDMWCDYYAVSEIPSETPHLRERDIKEDYISSSNPLGKFRGKKDTPKTAFIHLADLPAYLQLMLDQLKTEGLTETKFSERFRVSCLQERSDYRIHRTSKEVYENIRERINDYIA